MLKIFISIVTVLIISSCGTLFNDKANKYLDEKVSEPLIIPENKNYRQIVDFYPLAPIKDHNDLSSYELPLPKQIFSSGTSNEVRLHKLGELRWVYVETLPSSAWPLMKDFWMSNQYGLKSDDPNMGVIESSNLGISPENSKLMMKIEHGIRQSSSEIFVSHLIKDSNDAWIRVPGNDNMEEAVLLSALDFLSKSASQGGTSLVALNLNLGQKAVLKQQEDLTSYIELSLEFPRAWAAVDRALKEALINVIDLDRDEGAFYVDFIQNQEKGFFNKMFTGRSVSKGNFKILIKEIGENSCIVTVGGDNPESELYERDLLSEINQSLS